MNTLSVNRQVLTATLTRIRGITPVDIAFGGLVNSTGNGVTLDSLVGNETDALQDLLITPGQGLGGKALLLRQPTYVLDYHEAKGITHQYDAAVAAERMNSVFAVPIKFSPTCYGLLYGALRSDSPLSDRLLDQVYSIINSTTRQYLPETVPVDNAHPAPAAQQSPQQHPPDGENQQQLGDIHAALTVILNTTTEPATRKQIESLMERLTNATKRDETNVADIARDASAGPEPARSRTTGNTLTRRETDVLSLTATGCTNNEVCAQLDLELNTVKAYLRSISRKLAARNRTDAVAIARRKRIIP